MNGKLYSMMAAVLLAGMTSEALAQNWRDKNEGLTPTFIASKVYGEGTSILLANSAFGFNNHFYRRPDSSTAFVASASTFGGYGTLQSQIVKVKGTLFVGGTNGMFRSTDNGVTWTRSSATTGTVYSLYAVGDTIYAGVGSGLGKAKYTTDTGQTWIDLGYPGFMATHILKANGVLYVGSNSGLQFSPDHGTTWVTPPTSTGLYAPIITGLATLGGSVYAACSTGVYKTIDDGANWSVVLPRSMFSLTTIDTSLLGGTNNYGIFQSDQTGTNWNAINNGLPYVGAGSYNPVNDITYNSQFVIAITGGDSAVYVTNLADLGLNPTSPTTAVNQASMQAPQSVVVYPNPATDVVTVVLKSNNTTPATIEVMDVTGRTIYSTVSTTTQTEVPLNTLNAGCYYVRVTQGNSKTVEKLTILR